MAYLTVTPRLFEHLGQFANSMLRLRCGKAIPGHEDHPVGERQLHGSVFEVDLAHDAADVRSGLGDDRAEAAEEDVGDGTVHCLAHQDGEDESGEAIERAGDDEHVVAEDEARCGGRQASVGVQERHDHGHVGRPDGDHQHDAKEERDAEHGVEDSNVASGCVQKMTKQDAMTRKTRRLTTFWSLNWMGLP